jgi:hypothetical protein
VHIGVFLAGDSPDVLHFFSSVQVVHRSWAELRNSQSIRVVIFFKTSVLKGLTLRKMPIVAFRGPITLHLLFCYCFSVHTNQSYEWKSTFNKWEKIA